MSFLVIAIVFSSTSNVVFSYIMGEYITCWENNRFDYTGYHDPDYVNDTTYREEAGGEGDVCDHTDPDTNEVRDTCYFQVYLGQERWTYKCMHHNACPLKDPLTGEGIMGCYNVTNKRITCCCQEDFCNGEEYQGYALLGYPQHFTPQTTEDRSNKPQNGTAPTPKPTEPEMIATTQMIETTQYVDPFEDEDKPRIINGIPVTSNEYPWIVSLRQEIDIDAVDHELPTISHSFCGGLLMQLSPPIILTSAHCFNDFIYNETDDMLRVDLDGSLYDTYLFADIHRTNLDEMDSLNDTFETLEIMDYPSTIYIHHEYDIESTIHDIALLIFEDYNHTQFGLEIDSFPILSSNVDYNNDTECCLSNETLIGIGYGYTSANSTGSNMLQSTQMKFINTEQCGDIANEYLVEETNVTISNIEDELSAFNQGALICVHSVENDACYEDSNGLITRINVDDTVEVIGLYTFNMGECHDEYPSVYTSIAMYHEWILQTIDYVIDDVAEPDTNVSETADLIPNWLGKPYGKWIIAGIILGALCCLALIITSYFGCKTYTKTDVQGKYQPSHVDEELSI